MCDARQGSFRLVEEGGDDGRVQGGLGVGALEAERLAVAGRPLAPCRGEQLPADRVADRGQRAVLVLDGDRGTPTPQALQVVQRPVERVDDPRPRAGALRTLLAEVAVLRPLRRGGGHLTIGQSRHEDVAA